MKVIYLKWHSGAISSNSKNNNENSVDVVVTQNVVVTQPQNLKIPNTERIENKDKSSKKIVILPAKKTPNTPQA